MKIEKIKTYEQIVLKIWTVNIQFPTNLSNIVKSHKNLEDQFSEKESVGSFRVIKKKNLCLPQLNQNPPPLKESFEKALISLKSGQNDQSLELMFEQWNSIKHFNILFSVLKQEMGKKNVNFDLTINKYHLTMNEIEKKEKDDMEKYLIKHQGDRVYTRSERQKRIQIYLKKKKRRNKKYFIRYEIRKTLANNRMRSKGKFVKNQKIDINKLIEMVKQDQK